MAADHVTQPDDCEMSAAQKVEDFRLAASKVVAMLPLFTEQVRTSHFDMAWKVTAIAALADQARNLLSDARVDEDPNVCAKTGDRVAGIFWGIGEQLQGLQDEGRSDLCWGLLEGMEEILKKVQSADGNTAHEPGVKLPPAIKDLPGLHGHRGRLAARAGCAISDLAMALTKLMGSDKTAEMTLIRRIESLSGVVISVAEEDRMDVEYLEKELVDSP